MRQTSTILSVGQKPGEPAGHLWFIESEILSVIPAPAGWRVIVGFDDLEGWCGFVLPVICWALVRQRHGTKKRYPDEIIEASPWRREVEAVVPAEEGTELRSHLGDVRTALAAPGDTLEQAWARDLSEPFPKLGDP